MVGRPPKDPGEKYLRTNITYPPELQKKVKALAKDGKLSKVCQQAIRDAQI